jgi:hypothetical protein
MVGAWFLPDWPYHCTGRGIATPPRIAITAEIDERKRFVRAMRRNIGHSRLGEIHKSQFADLAIDAPYG